MRRTVGMGLAVGLLLLVGPGAPPRAAVPQGGEKSAAHAPQKAAPAGPIRHVLIVSIDGLMPVAYTDPAAQDLKVPTFRKIVKEGAYSEGVLPVMPTVTYPAHTTMATGVNPGTHGIVANIAWDPLDRNSAGWRWYAEDIRVPTLWKLARARGLRTALIGWPVTAGAAANFHVPEYWRASIPEDLKLIRALSTPGVLEEVAKRFPDFYGGFTPPTAKDASLTDIADYAIETERPELLMLHLPEVDHWQHTKGPLSPAAGTAIENADAQLARLIEAAKRAGIWQQTALVVVSDHGFAPVSQSFRPGVLLAQKGLITLDAHNRPTEWRAFEIIDGASAYIYVKDKNDDATRQTLLDTFQPLAGKPRTGIRRIATHDQIVAMGGDPEAFLALEAADEFTLAFGYTGDALGPASVAGAHGYFPDRPEMRASLLLYGPAIGAGKIENARLIDVAPTVARWLGLKLTKAEGRPLDIPARVSARPRSH